MTSLNFSSKNSSSHLLREKSTKSVKMTLLIIDDKSKDSILYILKDLFMSKKYKYLYNYIVQIEKVEKELDIKTFSFLFVTKLICINKILNQYVIKYKDNSLLLQKEYSNAHKLRITNKQKELEIQINKTIERGNKLYKSCLINKNSTLKNLNHINKEVIIQNFCRYLYVNSNYFLLKNYINEAIATLSMSEYLFKYIIDISENEITCSLYEQILIKLIYFLISDNSFKLAIEKSIQCLSICMKEMKIRTQKFNNILVFEKKITNEFKYILKIIYNIIIILYYLGVSYENLEYFFEAFDSYNQAKFFSGLIRNYFISENLFNFFSNLFTLSTTYYREIIGKHSKIKIKKRRNSISNSLSPINPKPNIIKRVNTCLFENRKGNLDKLIEKANLNVEKIINSKLINHSDIMTIHSKSKKKLKYNDITNSITIYNDLLSKNYWPFIKGINKINFNNIDYESSNKLERFNNQLLRDDKTNQEIEKEIEEKNKKHDKFNFPKSKSLTKSPYSKNNFRSAINLLKRPFNELCISEENNEGESENKENGSQTRFRCSYYNHSRKNNLFSKKNSECEGSNGNSLIGNNISNNAVNANDSSSLIGNNSNANIVIGNNVNKSNSISGFAISLRKHPSPPFDMSSYKASHKNLSINYSNINNSTSKHSLDFKRFEYNQIKDQNYLNKSLSYIKKFNSIKKFPDKERYIFSKKFKKKKDILEKMSENEINFQKKLLNIKQKDSLLMNKIINEQCNKNLNKNYQEEASLMYKKIMCNLSKNENNKEDKKKKRVYSVEYQNKTKKIKNNLIKTLVSSLDTRVMTKINEFEQTVKNKNNQILLSRLKKAKMSNIKTINDEKNNDDFIFNQSQNNEVIEIINDKIRDIEKVSIYYNKLKARNKKNI